MSSSGGAGGGAGAGATTSTKVSTSTKSTTKATTAAPVVAASTVPITEPAALEAAVRKAVREVKVVDVHTHLFPPSHGKLLLWGIDAMLTYHYLIAELFMILPASVITPEAFFGLERSQQADIVWQHLFVDRTPLSEACRGVLTTLTELGLGEAVAKRDLAAARTFFERQEPGKYLDLVLRLAGVRQVVMTNIPFDEEEARHWRDAKPVPTALKAALRVDQLLAGDWPAVANALKVAGVKANLAGVRSFLEAWVKLMKPVYLMASTPPDYQYPPTGTGESAQLMDILLGVAREKQLPIALKLGARRGVNPALRSGGDGVTTLDLGFLRRLVGQNPDVKFLVTVLARGNHHELAVLARKFGNLHVYGCWWFCNIPSIITEVTTMRLELLGTAFTAQHSDARVLDQLIYKWKHSRAVVADALVKQYSQLAATGWPISEQAIGADVHRLFGGAYEDFMAKQ